MTVAFDSVGRGRGDSFIRSIDARKHRFNRQVNVILWHIGAFGNVGAYLDDPAYPPVTTYFKMVALTNIILAGFQRVGMNIRLGILDITTPGDPKWFVPAGATYPRDTVITNFAWQNRDPLIELNEWPHPDWGFPALPDGSGTTTLTEWIRVFETTKSGFPFGGNKTSGLFTRYGFALNELFFKTQPLGSLFAVDFDPSEISRFLGASVNDLNTEYPNTTPLAAGGYLSDNYGAFHVVTGNGDRIDNVGRSESEWTLRGHADEPFGTQTTDFFFTWSEMWADFKFNMSSPAAKAYLPPPQNLVVAATAIAGQVLLTFGSGTYSEVGHPVVPNAFGVLYSTDPTKLNHAQATKLIGITNDYLLSGLLSGVIYYFAVLAIYPTFLWDADSHSHAPSFISGVDFSDGPLSNTALATPL